MINGNSDASQLAPRGSQVRFQAFPDLGTLQIEFKRCKIRLGELEPLIDPFARIRCSQMYFFYLLAARVVDDELQSFSGDSLLPPLRKSVHLCEIADLAGPACNGWRSTRKRTSSGRSSGVAKRNTGFGPPAPVISYPAFRARGGALETCGGTGSGFDGEPLLREPLDRFGK